MILLWSLISFSVTWKVTWTLECYSFQRSFTGPFDLSGLRMPIVTCGPGQEACLEAVSSLSTGYRNSLTLVKKGCSYGPGSGEMSSEGDSLPPDYTMVRQCQESLCNRQIESHDSIPNLSLAPDPPELSGTECWACVSTTAEGCEQSAHKIKCHGGQSVCYKGQGFLAIDNFNNSVYIRTCQEPTCTFTGAATHWSDNYLKGTCCKGNLCNGNSISKGPQAQVVNTVFSGAPSLLALPLLPTIPLLLGA